MSLGANELTLLGVGAAIGAAVTAATCALSASKGARLPTATSGMAAAKGEPRAPQYHSGVVKVKEGMFGQYTALHDHTWDQVMAKMHEVRPTAQNCQQLQARRPAGRPCTRCAGWLMHCLRGRRPFRPQANMRNFVVYYHEELNLMFHHWEYVGTDFEADMAKCDNDPISAFR
jgi:L-rhamnose mutarotase